MYEIILLVLSIHILFTDAAVGLLKKQVLTVYSGLGIQSHFENYYGSRDGYMEWQRLHSLNYRDRNALCLITYKATNSTEDLKFRTTKSPNSVLPYYIHSQNRSLDINVCRCSISRFEHTDEGKQAEVPWYDYYLAEAHKDHCVYRFSFPRVGKREEIFLEDSGVHALKIICEIDFSEYKIWFKGE